MVRTINEPLPTPGRPSAVASGSTARTQPTSHPISRIPIRSTTARRISSGTKGPSIALPSSNVFNKRPILGEREDNTFQPPITQHPKRKSRQSHIVVNPIQSAPSPTRVTWSTQSVRAPTASSPAFSRPPRPSFTRLNAGMDDDVTQLLDIRPSSPTGATTDDDWFSGAEEVGNVTAGRTPMPRKSGDGWGRAIHGGYRMMTPMNSQEIQTSTSVAVASLPKGRLVSRLPTPPSSQPPEPASTPQRPSPPSRRRARPSPTPPRRLSTAPSQIAIAEPSPNPRTKKTPRLASRGSVADLRQSSSPSVASGVLGASTTRKGKGRASKTKQRASHNSSRSSINPSASPDAPETQSPTPTTASRRKSTAPTKRRASLKPKARKSRSNSPPPAMVRYAGVSSRRKSYTAAALRRITGRDLEIGAGVDSVESSPGEDPLLLKPLYGSDTEVDEDEDEDRHERSGTLVGGSQTEPRLRKGKSRASGMGFSQSSVKSALSKSSLSATSSRQVITSFPFKPYTTAPPPPRLVPEWVPRTMKKKKVELDFDQSHAGNEGEDNVGNGSFDYGGGGFGSDADSDFGDGYTGDDTFMNIMTRKEVGSGIDGGKILEAEREAHEDAVPMISPRSPVEHTLKAGSASPQSSPLSTQHAIEVDTSHRRSLSPFIIAKSPIPDLPASDQPQPYSPSPSPARVASQHDDDEGDLSSLETSVLGLSYMGRATPISPGPSPSTHEDEENLDGDDEGAYDEELNTTVEADITVEGASGSWDDSTDSVIEHDVPTGTDTWTAYGGDLLEAEVMPADLGEAYEASPLPAHSGYDAEEVEAIAPLEDISHEEVETKSSPHPASSPGIRSAPVEQTIETLNFSLRPTPPRSPFRLLRPSTPSAPMSENISPVSTTGIPKASTTTSHSSPISHPTSSPHHHRVQSFEEAARSSLSSSQISESEGDLTLDAVENGWESDESVVVKEPDAQVEEEAVNGLLSEDEADKEADESLEPSIEAEMEGDNGNFEVEDEHDDLTPSSPENVLIANMAGESETSPYNIGPTSAVPMSNIPADAETASTQSARSSASSQGLTQDRSTPETLPTSAQLPPTPGPEPAGEKIVLSLITRIVHVKQESDEEDSEEEQSEEDIQDQSEGETADEDESADEEEDGDEEEDAGQEEEDTDAESMENRLEDDSEDDLEVTQHDGMELEAVEDDPISSPPAEAQADEPPVVNTTSTFTASPRKSPSTPTRVSLSVSTTPLISPPQHVLDSRLRDQAVPRDEPTSAPATRMAPVLGTAAPSAPSPTISESATTSSSLTASSSTKFLPRRQSNTTLRPSGLSQQMTLDTPGSSPAHSSTQAPAVPSVSAPASSSESDKASESPFADEGVSVRSAGKSLLAELARAGGKGKEKELRGVVEVSSLDPRAAARAAAILKLASLPSASTKKNHNYIEHGILPTSQSAGTVDDRSTEATTPKRAHASRRKSYTSHHFDSVASARKLSPEELLNEAELEIVVNETEGVPTPSRRRREGTAFSALSGVSCSTNFPVPGGWVRTPKRKRSRHVEYSDEEAKVTAESRVAAGKAWGVPEWKRLAKVYKEEKAAWVKEREVKAMPGGLMSWARRSTGIGMPSEEVKDWDEGRVVKRFLETEGVQEGKTGVWSEDVILLRVQALERRITTKTSSADKKRSDASPNKRARVDAAPIGTPAKLSFGHATSAPPPSTIKRVFGWVWGSSFNPAAEMGEGGSVPQLATEVEAVSKGKARAEGERPDSAFPIGRSDARSILPTTVPQAAPTARPMKDISTRPASALLAPPPRSALPRISGRATIGAGTTSTSVPAIPASASTLPNATSTQISTTSPLDLLSTSTADISSSFLGLSTSSSATSGTFPPQTPRIYPQLHQSISQRSAAIKALFPSIHPLGDSTSSTSSATSVGNTTSGSRADSSFARSMAIAGLSRKTSVKDLAKSFEEQGVLTNALTRVPSGSGEVEALKRVLSRERR